MYNDIGLFSVHGEHIPPHLMNVSMAHNVATNVLDKRRRSIEYEHINSTYHCICCCLENPPPSFCCIASTYIHNVRSKSPFCKCAVNVIFSAACETVARERVTTIVPSPDDVALYLLFSE